MGTPAPASVIGLVARFDQDRKVFLSGDYKEEQLRLEFLNPLFEALGWDSTPRYLCRCWQHALAARRAEGSKLQR